MANKVDIKWRRGALRGIRYGDTAPKVRSTLEGWAEKIASRANSSSGSTGYKTSSRAGRAVKQGRWRTTVITANAEAMRDNMADNTLVRSLFATKP